MTNPRRGSGLFNHLLGFPDPIQVVVPKQEIQPAPPMSMDLADAIRLGIAKNVKLWLDGKVFEIYFWPRPDSPFHDSYGNQILLKNGAKFFDFRINVNLEDKYYALVGSHLWRNDSVGTLEMQIVENTLFLADMFRRNSEIELVNKVIKFSEQASEYAELYYQFATRCDKFYSQRLSMLVEAQEETRGDVRLMMDREGNYPY